MKNKELIQLDAHYSAIMSIISEKQSVVRMLDFARQHQTIKSEVEAINTLLKMQSPELKRLIDERDAFRKSIVKMISEKKGIQAEEINPEYVNSVLVSSFPHIAELQNELQKHEKKTEELLNAESKIEITCFLTESELSDPSDAESKKKFAEVAGSVLLLLQPQKKKK